MGDRQTAQVPKPLPSFFYSESCWKVENSMQAHLQDLISFASPAPAAAKAARPSLSSDLESLTITNNNNNAGIWEKSYSS